MIEAANGLFDNPIPIAILVAVAVVVFLILTTRGRKPKFPFETKPVLTEAELAFHRALAECVPPDTILLSKVRLADFLQVTTRGDEFMRYFGKISQKHSDFLLVDAATSEPVLSIELDDSSHRRSKRTAESDEFKNRVYEAAGLAILRVPARRTYDKRDLRGEIVAALENESQRDRRQRRSQGRDLFENQ